MLVMRSLLFVPSNRDNMVARAHQTPADVIVLDLEDSVPPSEKEATRAKLRASIESLKAAGKTVHVRVNGLDTGLTRDDLSVAIGPGLDGLILPKAASARDIRQTDVMIREWETRNLVTPGTVALFPHVESAVGVLRCEEIAQASSRIAGIALGGEDYVASLGVARTNEAMAYARGVIATVCHAYGIAALDVIYPVIADLDGLQAETDYIRSIGFKGKYAIHPGQVETINRAFSPKSADLEAARRAVAAFDDAITRGQASVQVDGKMVDIPVAKRYRDLIALAESVGTAD